MTLDPPASHGLGGGGSVVTEALRGLLCGVCFGVTSPLVSHPLDVLKSRMQALPSASGGTLATLRATVSAGGLRALYAGLLPPLLGSSLYRGLQMSAYATAYAALGASPELCAPQPALGGLQLRVLLAGAAATSARALVETPLEVLKLRAQLGLPAPRLALRELYVGLGLTWARLYVALGGFFAAVDHCDRHHPGLFLQPGGSFLKGAVCATACWWLAWPLEVAKSRAQSSLHPGGALAQLRAVLAERGLAGLYRGLLPGTLRSLLGNGAALMAFDACRQALPTER
jgi:solute carrier family 25 carnitine/acylcarnitine transporter 20/29